MSDIKIGDMTVWSGGDVPAGGQVPFVYLNTNYICSWSQLTQTTLGLGSMAYQNSDAVNITGGNVAVTALSGAITVANGGTGTTTTPTNGQLLIGNGSGYALSTLTPGSGISITNGSGTVTIAATGGTGTVTSVDASGGTTGMSFDGGPITGSGTLTLQGTLAIANGGTGTTTAAGARAAFGAAASGANSDITSLGGLTTPLSVAQGGSGTTALSGYLYGNGSSAFSSVAAIPVADLTGQVAIANGGTAASTAAGARGNLLPSYAGNGGKVLSVNPGETDVQWLATGGVGTVTSVGLSGGTTGLTVTGSPITGAGTITLGGTLATANGGTGLTSFTANGVLYASGTGTLATGTGLRFDGTQIGQGVAPTGDYGFRQSWTGSTSTSQYGFFTDTFIGSTGTSLGVAYRARVRTTAAAFTLANSISFYVEDGTIGAGSTVTSQSGLYVNDLTVGTNNYGAQLRVSSGTNKWNLFAVGTADNHMAGSLGLGTTSLTGYGFRNSKNITGGTSAFGIVVDGAIQSDVTNTTVGFRSTPTIAAASFTLSEIDHFQANNASVGAGATLTSQYGFIANALTSATTNYAFRAVNSAAVTTGKTHYAYYTEQNVATGGGTTWAFYGAGTAPNRFDGVTQFADGSSSLPSITFSADLNTGIWRPTTDTLAISTGGAERLRLDNNGSLGFGTTSLTGFGIRMQKAITGATQSYGIRVDSQINSDVTSLAVGFGTALSTQATAFTAAAMAHFRADQSTIGAGSTVTNQYGFLVESSLTGGTNNYGFYGNIAAGTARWNFYANGTAPNYFAGSVTGAAGSTAMTDGFIYIPGAAGAPSGTPTSYSGRVALYYDTTGNKLYAYNGAWKSVTLA